MTRDWQNSYCPTIMSGHNFEHETARACKILFSAFSWKTNVKRDCIVEAGPQCHWPPPRAVEAASLAADGRRNDRCDSNPRKRVAKTGTRGGWRPARLTSLFSCASADLKVRLIHPFTSKLSSENAETSWKGSFEVRNARLRRHPSRLGLLRRDVPRYSRIASGSGSLASYSAWNVSIATISSYVTASRERADEKKKKKGTPASTPLRRRARLPWQGERNEDRERVALYPGQYSDVGTSPPTDVARIWTRRSWNTGLPHRAKVSLYFPLGRSRRYRRPLPVTRHCRRRRRRRRRRLDIASSGARYRGVRWPLRSSFRVRRPSAPRYSPLIIRRACVRACVCAASLEREERERGNKFSRRIDRAVHRATTAKDDDEEDWRRTRRLIASSGASLSRLARPAFWRPTRGTAASVLSCVVRRENASSSLDSKRERERMNAREIGCVNEEWEMRVCMFCERWRERERERERESEKNGVNATKGDKASDIPLSSSCDKDCVSDSRRSCHLLVEKGSPWMSPSPPPPPPSSPPPPPPPPQSLPSFVSTSLLGRSWVPRSRLERGTLTRLFRGQAASYSVGGA